MAYNAPGFHDEWERSHRNFRNAVDGCCTGSSTSVRHSPCNYEALLKYGKSGERVCKEDRSQYCR